MYNIESETDDIDIGWRIYYKLNDMFVINEVKVIMLLKSIFVMKCL